MNLLALACGLLFSLGLLVSGMVDPDKVLGFLDIGGRWDPSLALVLIGAVAANVVPMRLAMRRRESLLLHCPMDLPKPAPVTRRLVIGSVLFGLGWGASGTCPGPALVNLGAMRADRLTFFVCMVLGMAGYEVWNRRVSNQRAATPTQARAGTLRPAPAGAEAPLPGGLFEGPDAQEMTALLSQRLNVGDRYWIQREGQSVADARCYVVVEAGRGVREGDPATLHVARLQLDRSPPEPMPCAAPSHA